MSKAKFKVGQKVYDTNKKKYGVVTTEGFWDNYDWRYYVAHSGYTWSISEYTLKSHEGL